MPVNVAAHRLLSRTFYPYNKYMTQANDLSHRRAGFYICMVSSRASDKLAVVLKDYSMYLLRLVISVFTIVLLTSCVFVPEESERQKYADNCSMLTRQLTLSAKEIKGHLCNADDSAEACLLVYGVILPVGSFVISGSIVLVGNTLHWLEYQGACREGMA